MHVRRSNAVGWPHGGAATQREQQGVTLRQETPTPSPASYRHKSPPRLIAVAVAAAQASGLGLNKLPQAMAVAAPGRVASASSRKATVMLTCWGRRKQSSKPGRM